MPGGDGTGPAGMGPMTGRAAGYCAGYPVPGFMNPIPGRTYWGRGRGGGRGRRNWYHATGMPGWARAAGGLPAWGQPAWGAVPPAVPYGAPYAPSAKEQAQMLSQQAEALEQQLEDIRASIAELEKEGQD